MSLAQAAQKAIELGGIYDGHEAPDDVNKATKAVGDGAGRPGTGGGGEGQVLRTTATRSPIVASFAEVEVDVETGKYLIVGFSGLRRRGHGAASALRWADRCWAGRHWASRTPSGRSGSTTREYGVAVAKRFYQNKPPTILDVPVDMQWAALNIPDPETPVGARGVGEPPVGGGCASILNALSDALGDEIFQRAPVNADTILASLEAGRPMQHPLTAAFEGK